MHKVIQKGLSLIMALTLFVGLVPDIARQTAQAADDVCTVTTTLDKDSINFGDTVNASVTIDRDLTATAIELRVFYNADYLTLSGGASAVTKISDDISVIANEDGENSYIKMTFMSLITGQPLSLSKGASLISFPLTAQKKMGSTEVGIRNSQSDKINRVNVQGQSATVAITKGENSGSIYVLSMVPGGTAAKPKVDVQLASTSNAADGKRVGFQFQVRYDTNALSLDSVESKIAQVNKNTAYVVYDGQADFTVSTTPETIATFNFTAKATSGSTDIGFDKSKVITSNDANSDVLRSATGTAISFDAHVVEVTSATGGTVTATPTSAKMGDTVTLTATPTSGYTFSGVTVNASGASVSVSTVSGESNKRTFVMPGSAVTVTPTFTKPSDPTPRPTPTPTHTTEPVPDMQPVPSLTTTVTATGDGDGNYTATVSETDAGNIANALHGNIAVEGAATANSITVTLPAATVAALAASENKRLTVSSELGKVTVIDKAVDEFAAKGGDVTVTIAVESGQNGTVTITSGGSVVSEVTGGMWIMLRGLTSDVGNALVNTTGTEETAAFSTVTSAGASALLRGSATVALRKLEGKSFPDTVGRWMDPSVRFVTARGIFSGSDDGYYHPDEKMTRSMIAMVLYNMAGKQGEYSSSGAFPDVEDYRWYSAAAGWAKQASVMTGDADGNFSAGSNMTRETAARTLYNFAQYLNMDGADAVVSQSVLDSFTDRDDVGGWAAESMSWAVASGLFTGTNEGKLNPKGEITRAEMTALMMRFVELAVK